MSDKDKMLQALTVTLDVCRWKALDDDSLDTVKKKADRFLTEADGVTQAACGMERVFPDLKGLHHQLSVLKWETYFEMRGWQING